MKKILLLLASCLLVGCHSTKVVQVERVKSDSVYRAATRLDSLALRSRTERKDSVTYKDSVYVLDSVTLMERHDTVFLTRIRTTYKDRWLEKVVERVDTCYMDSKVSTYDTLYVAKVDSIPVVVEVEKPLSRWQSFKMRLGGWAMGALSGILLAILGYFLYLRR